MVTWSSELKLYRTQSFIKDSHNEGSEYLDPSIGSRSSQAREYIAQLECQIPQPPHYIKCAKVTPPLASNINLFSSVTDDVRLSVGQASGRITILSFDEINRAVGHVHPHVVKEFGPRINRPCYDIAHHRTRPEIIAAGYEKSRHDYAILLFDISRGSHQTVQENPSSSLSTSSLQGPILNKTSPPVSHIVTSTNELIPANTEIDYGSTCHSLCWFRDDPDTLCAGINYKHLKVYDTRASTGHHSGKASLQAATKFVYGVCIDPWLDHRIASYQDTSLAIWDTRNFEKPIVTLNQNRRIMKLAWSPTRSGLLCSVELGGSQLKLHDIQSWAVMSDGGDPAVTERYIPSYTPFHDSTNRGSEETDQQDDFKRFSIGSDSGVGDVISSFAWHPTQQHNLIAITRGGKLVQAVVPERITTKWSNNHNLMWPYRGTLRSFDNQSNLYDESLSIVNDVSKRIRLRAEKNIFHQEMVPEKLREHIDHEVIEAWKWMDRCKSLMSDPNFRNQFSRSITYPGIRTAFGLDKIKPQLSPDSGSSPLTSSSSHNLSLNLGSNITYGYWDDPFGNSGIKTLGLEDGVALSQIDPGMLRPKKIYVGSGRERTLKICGWGSDDAELGRFLDDLERKGDYERAAAIATFCLQIRKATEILQRGGSSRFHPKKNKMLDEFSNVNKGPASDLGVVAMALSGFSEERSGSLWREMVSSSHKDMSNPYLRAMFTFLLAVSTTGGTSNPNDVLFTAVLDEDILTADKIAFSSLHLPDKKLLWYVNDCWRKVLERGDLSGFYICGGSSQESVALLQKYVDHSGDIQTASWMAIKALNPEYVRDGQVRFWIDSYKSLLDSWGLYTARIKLDEALNVAGVSTNQEYQIYIACTYCQSTICRSDAQIRKHLTNSQTNTSHGGPDALSTTVKDDQRSKRQVPGTPKSQGQAGTNPVVPRYRSAAIACAQSNIRNEACPSCRKPLPRCAICLLNMGTLSGLVDTKKVTNSKQRRQNQSLEQKLTPFDKFFTWCQHCHHGGHAKHVMDWFSSHLLCPVFKCGCRCASLDPGTKLAELSIQNGSDVDIVKPLATATKDNKIMNVATN